MPDDDIGLWLWHLEMANTAIHDGPAEDAGGLAG